MASISKINKPVVSAIKKTIGKAFNKISTTDQNKIASALRTGLEGGVDNASKNTIRLGLRYNSAVKGGISDKSAGILNRAISTSENAEAALIKGTAASRNGLAGKKVTGKMTGAEFKARRAATANNGSAASTPTVSNPTASTVTRDYSSGGRYGKLLLNEGYTREEAASILRDVRKRNPMSNTSGNPSIGRFSNVHDIADSKRQDNWIKGKITNEEFTAPLLNPTITPTQAKSTVSTSTKKAAPKSNTIDDLPGDEWLDDGTSAETMLNAQKTANGTRPAPKSQADMGVTQKELDAAKGNVGGVNQNAVNEAVDEERAWYDTAASRKNAEERVAAEKLQAETARDNDLQDYMEDFNKLKKGNMSAEELKNAEAEYQKKVAARHKAFNNDMRDIEANSGPGVWDWVQGNKIDQAVLGTAGLGFAGAIAFGGQKGNDQLYSNPFQY